MTFRTIAVVTVLAAAWMGTALADVNKFNTDGFYLDSATTSSAAIGVKGKYNTRSDKMRARVKCPKGCPVRGRLKMNCVVGDGFFYNCDGTIGKKCQVTGMLFQHGFEGAYTCAASAGTLVFGSP
jgi:hypothetical protein